MSFGERNNLGKTQNLSANISHTSIRFASFFQSQTHSLPNGTQCSRAATNFPEGEMAAQSRDLKGKTALVLPSASQMRKALSCPADARVLPSAVSEMEKMPPLCR